MWPQSAMTALQYTARLLNRKRNPQVSRRRRMTSAIATTMKMLPAIGITQLKNQTPDGLRVAGGANCDVAKSIVSSQRASEERTPSRSADPSTYVTYFTIFRLSPESAMEVQLYDGSNAAPPRQRGGSEP